jgi:hypothetical protein
MGHGVDLKSSPPSLAGCWTSGGFVSQWLVMDELVFTFEAELWIYSGKGAWHFVTLPESASVEIRFFRPHAKGFKPVAVKATIGNSTWKTSVFPDSKRKSHLLAVKAEVRKREKLVAGQVVEVRIEVV